MITFIAVLHVLLGLSLALLAVGFLWIAAPLLALPGLWLCWIGMGLKRDLTKYQRLSRITHLAMLPLEILMLLGSLWIIHAASESAERGGGLLGGIGFFYLAYVMCLIGLSVFSIAVFRSVEDRENSKNGKFLFGLMLFVFLCAGAARGEEQNVVKVGVATVLSGDLSVLGDNIARTIETYRKRYLRHNIEFYFEDAKTGSQDGLSAYQSLINRKHVDFLIGGTTSNGTLAAKQLINQSKTPLITPLTGGSNIDRAGPFIFRIGNSDILNGYQQADHFLSKGITRVALLSEETEYTQDIAKFFRQRFEQNGGVLVYDENFLPSKTDFRTDIILIKSKEPQALFMSTQTGLAFGLFIKQFRQLRGSVEEIHTNFLAASNPDAFESAGDAIAGVYYMAPSYDRGDKRLKNFFQEYREDHAREPAIPFHTAGTVDALNLLQDFLDVEGSYTAEYFRKFLLAKVKNYDGLMGTYSFDSEGNADVGFEISVIEVGEAAG